MSKVFISYGRKDAKVAQELCAWLENAGIPCWIAPRDITSGVYAGEITRAVKASDILVVLHSRESAASAHIRNEVNIACNNDKTILPYCLDDSPYDDDMEYYLSSHQRINATGSREEDFARIAEIIREKRGETAAEAVPEPRHKEKKNRWILPLILLLLIALTAGLLFFRNRLSTKGSAITEPESEAVVIPEPSIEPEACLQAPKTAKPSEKATALPSSSTPRDPDADTFTGRITDGYPDGTGTYTFRKSRRIDMHDAEARIAQAGDYIYGNWTRGHLNYGTWYAADGSEKGFITIGDCPNVELDHQLGKCVH